MNALSNAQRRLWFLDQLSPGEATYLMPFVLTLRGPLDARALEEALCLVVDRHEVLRTTFAGEPDQPVPVVGPRGQLRLPVEEVSAEQAERLMREEAARPFELRGGPLLRARLLRLGLERHQLLVTLHHIIFDGWSMGLLSEELLTAYAARVADRVPELPELPMQYRDYAAWEQGAEATGSHAAALDYWKRQLAACPPLMTLPADRPRPPRQRHHGAVVHRRLDAALVERVRALGRREGCTLFMTLLAAFDVVLQARAGVDDVVVGTPVANRDRLELEPVIGCFVNTVVLRTDTSGDPSFRALLARVREVALGAYSHQDLPFDKLVEALSPERRADRAPLFQVLFQVDDWGAARDVAGVRIEQSWTPSGTAKFDLGLALVDGSDGLAAALEYDTDLFDAASAERVLTDYAAVLAAAGAQPDLPISSLLGRAQLRAAGPAAAAPPPMAPAPTVPHSQTEARLAEIWAGVLGVPQVGAGDNFFEVGGHSLSAIQLVARVSRAFGVQLMVQSLFESPTIAAMSRKVEQLLAGAPESPRLTPRSDRTRHPLSHNQERLLNAHRNAPDAPEVMPLSFAIEGPLDRHAFDGAVLELLRRHEVLLARFDHVGDQFVQRLGELVSPLTFIDLRGEPEPVREERALALGRAAALEPIDLARGPLFRLLLIAVAPERHLLFTLVHHALWDGVSAEVLVRELELLHAAGRDRQVVALAPPELQYADFAAWQRAFYDGPEGQAQIAWWRRRLDGARAPQLPTDRPRELVEARRRGGINTPFPRGAQPVPTAAGLVPAIVSRARQLQSTPNELMLAAFVAWLARTSAQQDLTICTQHHNRHIEGTQELVGAFAQALVLRVDTAGEPTLAAVLERVRSRLREARAHGDVCGPFLELSRFRVNFNFLPNLASAQGHSSGLAIRPWTPIDLGRTVWYDLTLHAIFVEREVQAMFWFNRELWDAETVRRWAQEYASILERMVERPDSPLLG